MKHTKGGWYRTKRGDTYRVETDKEHVAHCYGLTNECGANANLIAAAPELLKIASHLVNRDISSGDLRKMAKKVLTKATNSKTA